MSTYPYMDQLQRAYLDLARKPTTKPPEKK
jgi:hypothetical protein